MLVVVLDKTGTVTEGRPHVVGVHAIVGDPDEVLALAAAAERPSEHPLARTIVRAATERGLQRAEPEWFEAVPGRGAVIGWAATTSWWAARACRGEYGVQCSGQQELDTLRWAEGRREWGHTVIFMACNRCVVRGVALADRVKPDAADAVAEL